MLMTCWLAGIGLSLNLISGCTPPPAPCHRSTTAQPCPSAARCPSPVVERPVVARPTVSDPWLAMKDLEPLPDGLEPPAILEPAPATAEKQPATAKQRFLEFADEELTGSLPGAQPAPAPAPPAGEAQLRKEMENDLILGRHDLALGRLVTYVRDVANGKHARPSDALLAGLRADLLALARETQALAVTTKSRRFMILGLAAYQLLARLPLPAGGQAADANVWPHELHLALFRLLSEEASRLLRTPPAPAPPRKPGDRRAFFSIVRVGTPVVHGTLEAGAIRQVIRRRLPEVRACYGEALGRSLVAGVFQLQLTVDGWGRVTQARVGKNGTGDVLLAGCVEERMRGWIFPEVMPPNSLTQITYPLNLTPDN